MGRIDSETIQKVIDAATIVDVVSDFVSLKRRGVNYVGLCPFHNDRSPSFYVSPAKNLCKCFACGHGGTPIHFIMEHEQMTFVEAIRYLAKKYHIEITEHEVSDEDRAAEKRRELLFAANEFALKYFEDTLTQTSDGQDIGLAYFRHRGISDVAIKRFHLGYSLERGNSFHDAAVKAGFSDDILVETGLCVRRDDGTVYDRFKGRVIYPVHNLSGKVVAFGGRTLRSDKKIAKYVNSPESAIYSKSRELYGLFQAKRAIIEKKKCILVEGYMDVISMSQLGIENIVASSGTALTEGQIRLIHRFTDTVTVIYDSDPAGIKASLRGIDMLLSEGLNIKVVLLPDGEDPDSFSQSHSLSEVEQYLAEHEQDFIRFKTDILLKGAAGDPIELARAINDIVQSIAVIPDQIIRSLYVRECSTAFGIPENTLIAQLNKFIAEKRERQGDKQRRDQAAATLTVPADTNIPTPLPPQPSKGESQPQQAVETPEQKLEKDRLKAIRPTEDELIRYVVKYGMLQLPLTDQDGSDTYVSVLKYISDELAYENLQFANPDIAETFKEAISIADNVWPTEYAKAVQNIEEQRNRDLAEGLKRIAETASTTVEIKAAEKAIAEEAERNYRQRLNDYAENFLVIQLGSSQSDVVRQTANRLSMSRHHLSKYHSRYVHIETESEKLFDLLPRAVYGLRDANIDWELRLIRLQLKQLTPDQTEQQMQLLTSLNELTKSRIDFAKYLGERVILPRR